MIVSSSPSDEEWRTLLRPSQYAVLRQGATEKSFTSPLEKEKRAGVFLCAGCGASLFTSEAKVMGIGVHCFGFLLSYYLLEFTFIRLLISKCLILPSCRFAAAAAAAAAVCHHVFCLVHQFNSGTGWPSFATPLADVEEEKVVVPSFDA